MFGLTRGGLAIYFPPAVAAARLGGKHISYVRATALFFAACLFAPAMHAGIITFVATGETQDGSVLSGDIVINTTAGTVSSLSLTMSGPLSFTVTGFDSANSFQDGPAYHLVADNGSPIQEILLGIIGTTLVGYTGGGICTNGSSCTVVSFAQDNSGVGFSNFTSGSLTAVPEPSSMALVGSAMLGLAAWRRRRSAR